MMAMLQGQAFLEMDLGIFTFILYFSKQFLSLPHTRLY